MTLSPQVGEKQNPVVICSFSSKMAHPSHTCMTNCAASCECKCHTEEVCLVCARDSGTGAKHVELNRVYFSLDRGGRQTQLQQQPKEKISCNPMLCFAKGSCKTLWTPFRVEKYSVLYSSATLFLRVLYVWIWRASECK